MLVHAAETDVFEGGAEVVESVEVRRKEEEKSANEVRVSGGGMHGKENMG